MMDLNTVCFILFGLLFIGFLVLEGFDYGVGMLLPFLGESDSQRQAIIGTLAPVWEGNEVWLVGAGAVLFAAFPNAYATLFSGLYLALLLILVPLIMRGAAFEFRNKDTSLKWRKLWDCAIFGGSVLPALLWGIAVTNLLGGLPINGEMQFAGVFGDLISIYTLTGGLVFTSLFLLHGVAYLTLKIDQRFVPQVRATGLIIGKYAIALLAGFVILTLVFIGAPIAWGIMLTSVVALILCCRGLLNRRYAFSFVFSTTAIVCLTAGIFAGLFPRLIVSSLNPDWSLTIYNSASNPLALKIMAVTMMIVLPVVIGFEVWKYTIFRQRTIIAEESMESHGKLWEQLQGRLKELTGYADKISAALTKIKTILDNEQRQKALKTKNSGVMKQTQEFKGLLWRGRRLAAIMRKLIGILRP